MMKQITILVIIAMTAVFSTGMKAEENDGLTYFYIENLSLETSKNWYVSAGKTVQSLIKYICLPAKIIGVKKEYTALFKSKLETSYSKVKQVELTRQEAEAKCANQRTF